MPKHDIIASRKLASQFEPLWNRSPIPGRYARTEKIAALTILPCPACGEASDNQIQFLLLKTRNNSAAKIAVMARPDLSFPGYKSFIDSEVLVRRDILQMHIRFWQIAHICFSFLFLERFQKHFFTDKRQRLRPFPVCRWCAPIDAFERPGKCSLIRKAIFQRNVNNWDTGIPQFNCRHSKPSFLYIFANRHSCHPVKLLRAVVRRISDMCGYFRKRRILTDMIFHVIDQLLSRINPLLHSASSLPGKSIAQIHWKVFARIGNAGKPVKSFSRLKWRSCKPHF